MVSWKAVILLFVALAKAQQLKEQGNKISICWIGSNLQ